jgi:aryl-alcohol dehydrogenase-like predicted oxidoreductase
MDYRKIGSSGVKVSSICLGAAFRGFAHGRADEQTSRKTIERAVDLGINFIDCANFYFAGKCEELLGNVLKGLKNKRDDLIITSKVCSPIGEGPNDHGLSRFHIMREIDRSLKRLQLDHVDIYLLHNFDPETPMEETFRAMDDVVTQGKARYIGICNYGAAQVVEALWTCDKHHFNPPLILQNRYNLLNRWEVEPEILARCNQHGLGLMTFSPIAVGFLTGRIRRGRALPADALPVQRDRFDEMTTVRADKIVTALLDVASELGKTPVQVAFNWILDHSEVTAAISGPDLPEHIEEVCGAVGWSLPQEARKKLDDLSVPETPGNIF